jgi:hypothetical protein
MQFGANDQASPSEAERDALRVQAAAIAAQQVALALEEEKLRQRSAALERQEAQLAAHLEVRQTRLLELQEQVRKDRDALKSDRVLAEAERKELHDGLLKDRNQAMAATEVARKERLRLVALRKRLRQRWRRHSDAREADVARREQELSTHRSHLADEAEALQQERRLLLQSQLRFNGEVELGRRKLQDARHELSLAQQEWDACLNHENQVREQRTAELDARSAAVVAAEAVLAERELLWARKQADLTSEINGLENRVANLRSRLSAGVSAESEPWLVPVAPAPVVLAAAAAIPVPESIERLATDLADHRRHLLEQWGTLLLVQIEWESEREVLLKDLDSQADRLDEREQSLIRWEANLSAESESIRVVKEATDKERCAVEGSRARLATQAAAFDSERLALVSEAQSREEVVARETARLQALRQRWGERRRLELDEIQTLRSRYQDARGGFINLWQECESRQAALAREQREVSAKKLALERLRQIVVGRAADAAAAERRLAKFEQRDRARIEKQDRTLIRGQKMLQTQIARLDSEWKRLHGDEHKLAASCEVFDRRREEWEQLRHALEVETDARGTRLRQLSAQHERDNRQLRLLREEIELIARHLIGEGGQGSILEDRQAA